MLLARILSMAGEFILKGKNINNIFHISCHVFGVSINRAVDTEFENLKFKYLRVNLALLRV